MVRVTIKDIDGRHIVTEDDDEFVGPWILRTMKRVQAKNTGRWAIEIELVEIR